MGVGEFVGWRALAGEDTDGALYTMGLTEEPVVRCRDCRRYDPGDAGCAYWVLAENRLLHINDPDGFCKWGERR